jgi:hypothetical protein
LSSQLRAAGHWLAHSGIQFPSGGVARYYRADVGRNRDISTEITGYAVSALVYAYRETGDAEFIDAATRGAHFLTRSAWNAQHKTVPFELNPPELAYFFDCGIIVRGLLALWRVTSECELVETAQAIADSMARDFAREDGMHWPVLTLPEKAPVALDLARWSRTPGCYQLKSAVAWRELAAITGEGRWGELYSSAVENAMRSHESYLPGPGDADKQMDRLHPYLYFLEALLAHEEHAETVRQGAARVSKLFRTLAPRFERADVAAQLLRVLCASGGEAADCADLAARIRGFQREDGGYYFGRRGGEPVPHVSPVPAVFAMQALEWLERPESIDRADVI